MPMAGPLIGVVKMAYPGYGEIIKMQKFQLFQKLSKFFQKISGRIFKKSCRNLRFSRNYQHVDIIPNFKIFNNRAEICDFQKLYQILKFPDLRKISNFCTISNLKL